jgi:hypothetical protein
MPVTVSLLRAALLAAMVSIGASHAYGQSGGAQTYSSFLLTARAPNILVGTISTNEALGLPAGVTAPVALVCNTGPVTAYVAIGGVLVAADPSLSMPVVAGKCISMNATGSTNIAAITDATADQSPTLMVMLGQGNP